MKRKKLLSAACAAVMALSAVPGVSFAQEARDIEENLVYYASFDTALTAEKGGGVNVYGNVSVKDNAAYFPNNTSAYLTLTDEEGNDNLLVGKSEFTIVFNEKRESGKWPLYMAPSNASPSYNSSENYIGLYDDDAFRLERYVGARNQSTSSTVSNNDYRSSAAEIGWRNVAVVLTDSSSAVYIDGVKVGESTSTSKLSALFASKSLVTLGHAYWGSGESYGGYIDEFKIYDVALTHAEAAKLAGVTMETVLADLEEKFPTEPAKLKEDIQLPTADYGALTEWSSSDESVVSSAGKVNRQIGDKTVTLTAKVTYGEQVEYKEFTVVVESLPTAESVLEKITIDTPERILDSLDLPTQIEGVDISYSSSDEDVITSKPKDNNGYTIPAGYVTRGDSDQNVTLSATVNVDGEEKTKDFPLTVKAAKPEEEKVAYLYAYFRGYVNGGVEHLQIHVATSEDGYVWTDLNGNWPILTSTMGTTGLRDPYIIRSRYGDKFYLIATDLNTLDGQGWGPWSLQGSKYLAVWESEDLVNWSEQRLVKFANDDIGCAWAPEAIYDEDTGEYLVYAAGKDLTMANPADTVYVVRTRDFKSFSEPEYFTAPVDSNGNRIWAIDSSIIKADDGKYYQFYKHNSSVIKMLVSDHASGPYTEVSGFTPIGGEGPAEYKVNGTDQYCLCVDNYSVYVPYLTDDIASGVFTKSTAEVVMPTGSKHGVMVPVSQREYDNLLKAYGPAVVDEDGSEPFLEYDFEGEVDGLMGNATIVADASKGGNVLYLDGTDNTYFDIPAEEFKHKNTLSISMDVKNEMPDGNCFTLAMGTNDRFYFFFKDTATRVKTAITNGGNTNNWEQSASADFAVSNVDKWEHFDLVITPDETKIFKNGQKVAQTETTITLSHVGLDNLKVYLGKSFYSGNAYYKGSFDNVKFYNRALSEAEIAENMGLTDEEAVKLDAENVSFGCSLNDVTGDITLPAAGVYGSSVTWESSNEAIVAADGSVTVPKNEQGDKIVVLTGTFKKGEAQHVATYTLIVKAPRESWSSTADWTARTFNPVKGEVYINFDITPKEFSNGYMGISSSSLTTNSWATSNIIVRILPEGTFDAHNGSQYAATNTIPYELNKTYHITIKADTKTQTYSAYVTDENKETKLLADNFSYRSRQGSDLSKIVVRGGDSTAANLYTVSSFTASNYPVYVSGTIVSENSVQLKCQSFGDAEKVSIFAASYDTDDNLLSINIADIEKNKLEEPTLSISKDCSYVKIYAWEKGTLKPMGEVIVRVR